MKRLLVRSLSGLALIALVAAQAWAKEITVRGRLSQTVEAGGWLIVADTEKYLVLNAANFQNEAWFRVNEEVEAKGETRPGTITTYQEGTPFEVRSMRPVGGGQVKATEGGDARRLTRVHLIGDAIVQAQPDTAILYISVITQHKRALDAQQENANKSDAVVRALKAAAGAGAEVKTSGYSVQPQRMYRENQPPTITGYEARNSVIVTIGDLSKVGAVIDVAAQAGANNVDNVAFTLRKDRPARDQALAEATREAISKAQVMAQALGGRVARIAEVREADVVVRPLYDAEFAAQRTMAAPMAKPTPVEIGTLDINSRVQLVAEIEIRQD